MSNETIILEFQQALDDTEIGDDDDYNSKLNEALDKARNEGRISERKKLIQQILKWSPTTNRDKNNIFREQMISLIESEDL